MNSRKKETKEEVPVLNNDKCYYFLRQLDGRM